MKISRLLLEKKPQIIKKWFDLILETYPADTARFLASQNDRFANPVGHTISEGLDGIFEEVVTEFDHERITRLLDNILRIRALQKFAPSEALAFVFDLKRVLKAELALHEQMLSEEVCIVENRIDDLAKMSFDIYMKCREKLYEIKANEVRNLTSRLLQRVNEAGHDESEDERTGENSLFKSLYS